MSNWADEPTEIEKIPDNIDYILTIDENGISSCIKNIYDKIGTANPITDNERFLTLTGIIMNVENHRILKIELGNLKCKYWNNNGMLWNKQLKCYEKIHLHAIDFRNQKRDAFRVLTKEKYEEFLSDINNLMDNLTYNIICINIDHLDLAGKYSTPFESYKLATLFMIERFAKFLEFKRKKGIIIFESRSGGINGNDNKLLQLIVKFFSTGSNFVSHDVFSNIDSVYFNPKRPSGNPQKSYVGIEFADICSYTLNKKHIDKSYNLEDWKIIEKKLLNYPNYNGIGLKKFP